MTKLYIIRHAEAEGNIYRRIDGHYNSRITANGYRQIAALKKRFEAIPIDAVYASDLFRTCETAKALTVPKGLPLQKDARFREVNFGIWEDCNFGRLEQFESVQMYNLNHNPSRWNVEGAETVDVFTGRFLAGLSDVACKHEGQTVAIFTHGCVSGEAMNVLFGEQAKNAGRCDNTGVSLLQYECGRFSFEYLNDNSHLSEAISTLAHQLWWRGKQDYNLWFRNMAPSDTAIIDNAFLPYEGHTLQIAVLTEHPVGYISYGFRESTVTVSCLYLKEEFRHIRMGDQLLGVAVTDGRKNGCTRLTASVPTQYTDALAFFSRMGAEVTQMDDAFTVFSMPIDIPEY